MDAHPISFLFSAHFAALEIPFASSKVWFHTNSVPITFLTHYPSSTYEQFCEGCESKNYCFAVCARVRAREKPKMRAALPLVRRQPQHICSVMSFLRPWAS